MRLKLLLFTLPMMFLFCWSACMAQEKKHQAGDIEFETSIFTTRSGDKLKFQLGTFYVKENRNNPESRIIGIGFALHKARRPLNPASPPIFFLPGGPGSSYIRSKLPILGEQLWENCDVVLVDQRGYSQRGGIVNDRTFSVRPLKSDATLEDRVAEYIRFSREVVKRYSKTEVDLRGYSVTECIEDVHELRQALGYKKITLRGQSFGSQWSFGIMRKYPESVERALLSGVEPLNNSYDMPSHVFSAIRRMWRFIDKDKRFKPYLPAGGMEEAAEAVIARLENGGIRVFAEGENEPVRILGSDDFPYWDPRSILELYHGQLSRWAKPRSGWGRPSTLLQAMIDSSLNTTPARRQRLWNDPAVRYLSRRNFAGLMASAEVWPSPDVGDEFRTPVKCDVPVVFINGDWDVKTPIENMYEIVPYFSNRHQVVVHRAGHGTITTNMERQHPEFIDQLVEFLKTGDITGIPAEINVDSFVTFSPPEFKLVESNAIKPNDE